MSQNLLFFKKTKIRNVFPFTSFPHGHIYIIECFPFLLPFHMARLNYRNSQSKEWKTRKHTANLLLEGRKEICWVFINTRKYKFPNFGLIPKHMWRGNVHYSIHTTLHRNDICLRVHRRRAVHRIHGPLYKCWHWAPLRGYSLGPALGPLPRAAD